MTNVLKASMLAAVCFSIVGTQAHSQAILSQSKDDLLKEFDAGKSLTAPPQFSGSTSDAPQPTWAPASPGSAGATPPNQPFQGNYSKAPGAYQFPGQAPKPLLKRIIEGAMNAVNVTSNDTDGTHVKVPFVNIDLGGQSPGVKVKAPFVKYDSDNGADVKAPFAKYNSDDGLRIKGPFVDINHGGKNSNTKAPAAQKNPPTAPLQEPSRDRPVLQNSTGEQGSSLK